MPENMLQLVIESLAQHQSLSLVGTAIAFLALERILPHYPVDRRRDLGLDVVGVIAGLAFVAIAYGALHRLVDEVSGGWWAMSMCPLHTWPSAAKVAMVVLLVDFTIYWLHRSMHRWPFSWRMHRWHHSIEQMYWFAGFRASFPHILLYGIPQVVLPTVVFDLSPLETTAAAAIANFVQIWTHTNIRVDIGPLQWLIVTPAYHRVHHRASAEPARNFGNLLTIWDRMFGTHEAPRREVTVLCGLAEPRPPLARMLLGV
jgi:sterol desaturase/sphingolipid hydroxylase (fatty acid hydroxylase superfamily)